MAEQNTTLPATENSGVALIAVAWEITEAVTASYVFEAEGEPEERAARLAKIFVETLNTLQNR